jgi:hypothetical protein
MFSPPLKTFPRTHMLRFIGALLPGLTGLFFLGFGLAGEGGKELTIAGAVLLALAILIYWLVGRPVLSLHVEGVRRGGVWGERELRWEEMKEYRYHAAPATNTAVGFHAGGLIGMFVMHLVNKSRERKYGREAVIGQTLVLHGSEGGKIAITPNFQFSWEAIREILGKIHPPLLAEYKRRIDGGDTAVFGPVSLSRMGIAWKNKPPVPLQEISKAQLAGPTLRVQKTGKMLALISVHSSKVPNVLTLLDLLEHYGAGGAKVAGYDPLARVV